MKLLNGLPEIGSLNREQELSLILAGDEESLNTLVLAYMAEAFWYSRRCCGNSLPDDDLFSLCYTALSQASGNYDPAKSNGITFFAFCKQYLRGQISREWRRKDVVKNSSLHETEVENLSPAPEEFEELNFEGMHTKEAWAIIKPICKLVLNKSEYMMILLRFEVGWTYEEIGKKLGITRQAAEKSVKKSIPKIKKGIQQRKLKI